MNSQIFWLADPEAIQDKRASSCFKLFGSTIATAQNHQMWHSAVQQLVSGKRQTKPLATAMTTNPQPPTGLNERERSKKKHSPQLRVRIS